MGDKVERPEAIRPPRWAEALLRISLAPDEAETESGDLLEAYRDSIYPLRGRWRADLWFVRQVAGYIVRASPLNLRNSILAGLALSMITIVFSVLRYPNPNPGQGGTGILFAIVGGFLLYGYIAVRCTRPATPEDALVLRLGTRWGLVIGAVWIISYICGNLVIPHRLGANLGFQLALVAFSLPFLCGAHGAIKTDRVGTGMRVGFWSGLISGLMVFLAVAILGYVLAYVPGFPGAEIPAGTLYTAAEFQRLNVFDALGGALFQLFPVGGLFGVTAGTAGGAVGILLARTARITPRPS